MGNGVTRPSREVDRGRHDLCGFAAITTFSERFSPQLPVYGAGILMIAQRPPGAACTVAGVWAESPR